jgi:hypothetical protein
MSERDSLNMPWLTAPAIKLMPPYFNKVAVWVVAKDIDNSVFKLHAIVLHAAPALADTVF